MIRSQMVLCRDYFLILLFAWNVSSSGLQSVGSNQRPVVVGVVTTGDSKSSSSRLWAPTFENYLEEAVAQYLDVSKHGTYNFSMVPLSVTAAFQMADKKEYDFIFSTPSVFSCLENENSGWDYALH